MTSVQFGLCDRMCVELWWIVACDRHVESVVLAWLNRSSCWLPVDVTLPAAVELKKIVCSALQSAWATAGAPRAAQTTAASSPIRRVFRIVEIIRKLWTGLQVAPTEYALLTRRLSAAAVQTARRDWRCASFAKSGSESRRSTPSSSGPQRYRQAREG